VVGWWRELGEGGVEMICFLGGVVDGDGED